MAEYRNKKRREAFAMVGRACASCGSSEDLQFDHIDPKTKRRNIADMITFSKDAFRKELEKCQVLCGDCHKKKTKSQSKSVICGTYNKYRAGCKCAECRRAGHDYRAAYFARTGQ